MVDARVKSKNEWKKLNNKKHESILLDICVNEKAKKMFKILKKHSKKSTIHVQISEENNVSTFLKWNFDHIGKFIIHLLLTEGKIQNVH